MELSDCEGGLIWKDVVEADKAAAVQDGTGFVCCGEEEW